jgi:hypothetical protein
MIDNIYIFDDIVNIEIQNKLEEYAFNRNVKWELKKNITGGHDIFQKDTFPAKVIGEKNIDVNILKLIDLIINNVLLKLNKKLLKKYRIKINKTKPYKFDANEEYRLLHVDRLEEHMTIIYYINDSDGDTLIFHDENNKHLNHFAKDNVNLDSENFVLTNTISPQKGRVVVFDGKLWHYGKYPTKSERNIININLVINSEKTSLI